MKFLSRQVQAIDKDVGENGDIRYELLRGSGELFRVDRRTGEILLRHALEGQHHSDYELVVAAYDGGTPPLSSEALVRVKVVDKTQPVFGQQYYSALVAESADPLSPVLSVQASSPSGRQLIYSIVSGNEGQEFAVDFNTGSFATHRFVHPSLTFVVLVVVLVASTPAYPLTWTTQKIILARDTLRLRSMLFCGPSCSSVLW